MASHSTLEESGGLVSLSYLLGGSVAANVVRCFGCELPRYGNNNLDLSLWPQGRKPIRVRYNDITATD